MSETDPNRERVAVVTGAGTGLGQAMAAKFGSLGWKVGVGGRRVERLQETVPLVEKAGGTCLAHALDVTSAESVERFFEACEAELGPVDVVINNAAIGRFGRLEEVAPEQIQNEVATKLTGSLLMARRGIQSMRAGAGTGDILFISSASAGLPWPFHLPYASANAGVEHAARCLRHELEGTGIRVGVLRCGETIGTEFAGDDLGGEEMGKALAYWLHHGQLRHSGAMTPDMVADTVTRLVTLPPEYQYESLSLSPTAPVGELPSTLEEFMQQMMRHLPKP